MAQYIFMKALSSELPQYMFKDFNDNPNITIVNRILPFPLKFNILVGDAATKFRNVPFIQFCYSFFLMLLNPFRKIKISQEHTYLMFLNISSREVTPYYLNRFLKKHPNCTPVMIFFDPVDNYMSLYAKMLIEKVPGFLCLTYDPNDARKYNMLHTLCMYSKCEVPTVTPENDIYFSFTGMKRLNKVQAVTDHLLKGQVNANIIIAGEPSHEKYIMENTHGIHFLKSRKIYKEVLEDVSKTNCLLEILQDDHAGTTLRYFEAICYNKKLITNNKNIFHLPFYNPNYMKYFEHPEEIDCEWIKEQSPVSYGYNGQFSPLHLLENIETLYLQTLTK